LPSTTTTTLASALSAALLLAACGSETGGGLYDCASPIGVGDLVITEIYGNSPGGDEGNEWFEIYNAGTVNLNLRGMVLVRTDEEGDTRKEHVMREIVIEPGQYMVLGGILEKYKFEYIDYGYGPDLGAMGNSSGRLLLTCDGTVIDEVSYVDLAEGKSSQLSGLISPPDAVENDDWANFCTGKTAAFFQDQLGTPGEANEICAPLTQDDCVDNGAQRPVTKPGPGDVVISEFMASPSGTDGDREWLELRINAPIDLNGLQLGRAEADTGPGKVLQTLAAIECLPANAGDFVVLVRSTDAAINGGVDADFALEFGLVGDNDGLFVGVAGTVLDTVLYASSTEGKATQIDVEGDMCLATEPYGDGDLGTPGSANGDCPAMAPAGMCIDGTSGQLRAIVRPAVGNLFISEWLPNPEGVGTTSDAGKEWLELRAAGATFDMNEIIVDIPGKTNFAITSVDCLEVNDGDFFVIAESGDAVVNVGLPVFDYVATSLEFYNSGDRTFTIASESTILDTATINATIGSGESVLIDADGEMCQADDSSPAPTAYGTANNRGTPGAANGNCPPT